MLIGEVATELGISTDTLRYYEKIGLLSPVTRTTAGTRRYGEKDLSRIRFIQRAKKMGFSLDEVARLLEFRQDPRRAKPRVRSLAGEKLQEIESRLRELHSLRDELRLLVNLCTADDENCPIIAEIDQGTR